MGDREGPRRVAKVAAALATGCLLFAGQAQAAPPAHGVVKNPKPGFGFNANQSSNWFGYNQGTQEQGGKQFHSITANWTVPKATQHTHGQDESSATWAGIGGGCIDASCMLTDPTLIQTGTEQDVDSSGKPSYSAWWEIIPLPSITISSMTVNPGDQMHADITEAPVGSEMWQITLKDVTRGESFTTSVPYPSTYATAEWIEEAPLEFGTGGVGQASLPRLAKTPFDNATTNGSAPGLKSSEEIQLVDQSGKIIGAPSAPNSKSNGFADCAWAKTCSPPSS